MTNEDLQQIQALVTGTHKVLVLTHKNPSVDTMASALSLSLALGKLGKDVTVAMESQPLVEVANLVGIDQVKTTLSGKNLLLTYKPYTLGDFEKVSYLEDPGQQGNLADSFKLTITPRDGFAPDPANFTFSSTGTAADLIFTVDVLEPSLLGTLYDPAMFSATPIINIDNHDPNKDYGRFNLVEPEAASISEIVTFFLRAVNAQLDADIAGNLYQGIEAATSHFQSPKVAAATFEAAAICLRAGAKGKPQVQPQPQAQPQPVQPAQPQKSARDNSIPADWTQPKAYRGTSTV
ncbi:MAG: DHH family phosphoesterase [Patescibacteria group bacterium]|nr:DHH family phosphoesterase [Patescibacteria group bacterium]MCL5431799.1 DHH family phosphoesterase [Patescibacteria group bacterium]